MARNAASESRCSSHASQVFSRSGAWIVGLFQTTVYAAAARHPFAEQTTDWLIPPPFDAKLTGSDHGSRLR